MITTYINTNKIDTKSLSKNLNIIYSGEKTNLKDGRDGCKRHWWGYDIWISEYSGSEINKMIIEGTAGVADVSEIIGPILELSASNPFVLGVVLALLAEWAITWIAVDEGSGIHISVERIGYVIVYAHAQ